MAGKFPDDQIAATLNRLNFRTGTGNTWTEGRIPSLRSYHEWPIYDPKIAIRQGLTLEEASERLGVSHKVVRRLIDAGKISATQVVPWAPWEISAEAVESEEVLEAVRNAKRRLSITSSAPETVLPLFVEF
jgi:excisionase family DNA binding protein